MTVTRRYTGFPTGATFSGGIGDAWEGDPPPMPGINWKPTGAGNYTAYADPVAPRLSAPQPRPSQQARPSSGGGGFTKAWADYMAEHEQLGKGLLDEVSGIQSGIRSDFNRIMEGFRGAKKMAETEYGDIQDKFNTDISGLPELGMKLPVGMGGGTVPLAPGKWQQMYSNIANTRSGLTGAKLNAILASLTGEGQSADAKAGRLLQGSSVKGNIIADWMSGIRQAIGGQQSYDLGLKGLDNQMAIAEGGWANNLALQGLRNEQSTYEQQQRLNELDKAQGSSWLQPVLSIGGMIAGGYLGNKYGFGIDKGAMAGGALGSSIGSMF